VLTAASLTVAGPAVARAVALAKRLPSLRIGLHLTLLEGTPVAPLWEIPNLVDARGQLRRDLLNLAFKTALSASMRRQFRREIAAQFSAYRRTGLPFDHVSSRKQFHVHPLLAAEVVAACREFGVPALRVPREPAADIARVDGAATLQPLITPWLGRLRARARRAKLLTPTAVIGLRWSGHVTARRLVGALERLPDGLIEFFTHPATSDVFPGHAAGYRYTEELAALTDPQAIEAVGRSAHHCGGYSDFVGAAPLQLAETA
jgi:hopanoid biosynthesis associated protein HpnK